MTQNQSILNHLATGHTLTALEALNRFQCLRLAARIADLRAAGYDVVSRMVKLDSGKRVAEYQLKGQER